MKKSYLFLVLISLFAMNSVAQPALPEKNLSTSPVYNGQGAPSSEKFISVLPADVEGVVNYDTDGMRVTAAQGVSKIEWYATKNHGFNPANSYTIEVKAELYNTVVGEGEEEVKYGGFYIEAEPLPGKRIQLYIDDSGIYNETYGAREILLEIDNSGTHVYRIAVDNDDQFAYIYRDDIYQIDFEADGTTNANNPVFEFVGEPLVTTEGFETEFYTELAVPAEMAHDDAIYQARQAELKNLLISAGFEFPDGWIDYCVYTKATAPEKVVNGETSFWFQNGATARLRIKANVEAGKSYVFSLKSKMDAGWMFQKGYLFLNGDWANPLVSNIYLDGDQVKEYNYFFKTSEEGEITVEFHNGWGEGAWATFLLDDISIQEVESSSYVRFGKTWEASDFKINYFTFDVTGAYGPGQKAGVKKEELQSPINVSMLPNSNLLMLNSNLNQPTHAIISIVNAGGAVVSISDVEFNAGVDERSMDISNLPQGSYLLRISSNGKNHVLKFIK